MYIRETKTRSKKTNTTYISHKLVESYRTEKGVRQRVIMSLGTLTLPRRRWRELAALLEARLAGQHTFIEADKEISSVANDALQHHNFINKHQQEQIEADQSSDMQMIDLNSTAVSYYRSLGAELVADAFWKRLDFDGILERCGFDLKQRSVAKAVIVGRLIHPGSELGTWRWFNNSTSLIEMTEEDIEGCGKDAFYEIGDLLLYNKEKIEQELFKIEQAKYLLDRKIFLYDLTNTYLEGSAKANDKANYGPSKEKRTDCPLVALALVVDESGFPVFSQVYEGNKGEPKTLEDMLEQLEKDGEQFIGSKKPVLVMDKGIATNGNIDIIKEKEYPYTVIKRAQTEKAYEKDFQSIKAYISGINKELPDGWESVGDEVFVMKKQFEKHCHVLSVSTGRTSKENGMDELKEKRFLEDIEKLKSSFQKGNILLAHKLGERIGRIKAKYPTACKYYDIELKIDETNKVTDVVWAKKPSRNQRTTLTGCYVIETTQEEYSAAEIWKQYMLLHRVENAFEDLKSELGLRPIHHKTAARTESHLFIGVLAYHLLTCIETSLKSNGDTREWKTIKSVLATHQRSTEILKGTKNRIYHIRISGTPEPCHIEIYNTLKIVDTLKRNKRCIVQRL